MKLKKQESVKHQPEKWKIYKGRFGKYQKDLRPIIKKPIEFPKYISITEDDICFQIFEAFQISKGFPKRILDFRKVEQVTLRGGLALKAFFDEYLLLFGKKPDIRGPLNKKSKAVFKYLGLKNFNIDCNEFKDITCWQIRKFTNEEQKKIDLPRIIMTEIIPNCWENHSEDKVSKDIVRSVSEALYNCQEHAYKNSFEQKKFKNWYLGVGEYPNTNSFSFCIYDKGQGIKNSMVNNSSQWDKIINNFRNDVDFIDFAVKGNKMKANYNRGEGLKKAVAQISEADGTIQIISGKGLYNRKKGINNIEKKDRLTNIIGTIISYNIPFKLN